MIRLKSSWPKPRLVMAATLFFNLVLLLAWANQGLDAGAYTTSYAQVAFTSAGTNDPPGAVDPGYTKDVAQCTAVVTNFEVVDIAIQNGYPSYTCTFTVDILNTGYLPVKLTQLAIEAPWVLTVTDLDNHLGMLLQPGQRDRERFSVHVEQPAEQGATYSFQIEKTFKTHATGTVGFWKNWNSHKTYSKTQIETWLGQINNASNWYGPTTVQGMVNLFNAGTSGSATQQSRFLAQCLATNLNLRSGRQSPLEPHNVTGADPGNYLGLADPTASTLPQILARIETKFGTSPTDAQFLIMKDVCDKLNNAAI